MNGLERIEAALSPAGTREIPAVICYEDIFFRDHLRTVSDTPWWYQQSPVIEHQIAWRRDALERTGLDWLRIHRSLPRVKREVMTVEERSDGVYLIDNDTGSSRRLMEPPVGGEQNPAAGIASHTAPETGTAEEIDRLVPLPADEGRAVDDGSDDLARALIREFSGLYPYARVSSPLWRCYDLWGFENLMVMIALRPELVAHAAARYCESCLREVRIASSLGARSVWIEECLTDMIGPDAFAFCNLPFLKRIVEEIRSCGMKSIYYYCGNPEGKWDLLLDSGADALSLEEAKKDFDIDIDDVAELIQGRMALFGNLDTVYLLQEAPDPLFRSEITRQIACGRINGSRFVMSTGSPVTPGTTVSRVRKYCDLVRELGGG